MFFYYLTSFFFEELERRYIVSYIRLKGCIFSVNNLISLCYPSNAFRHSMACVSFSAALSA